MVLQKKHFGQVWKKPWLCIWQALIQKSGPSRRNVQSWVCTKSFFLLNQHLNICHVAFFFLIRKKIFNWRYISGWKITGQMISMSCYINILNQKFKSRSLTLSNWTFSEFVCVSRNLVQETTQRFTYAISRRDQLAIENSKITGHQRRKKAPEATWLASKGCPEPR